MIKILSMYLFRKKPDEKELNQKENCLEISTSFNNPLQEILLSKNVKYFFEREIKKIYYTKYFKGYF